MVIGLIFVLIQHVFRKGSCSNSTFPLFPNRYKIIFAELNVSAGLYRLTINIVAIVIRYAIFLKILKQQVTHFCEQLAQRINVPGSCPLHVTFTLLLHFSAVFYVLYSLSLLLFYRTLLLTVVTAFFVLQNTSTHKRNSLGQDNNRFSVSRLPYILDYTKIILTSYGYSVIPCMPRSVSYTHLDVYKRQVQGL